MSRRQSLNTQKKSILEAKGISKSYVISKGIFEKKRKEVLQDCSLNLQKGEILGIVGRSGIGKSTLLRCIMGMEEADSGCIILDQQKIFEKQWREKAKINLFSEKAVKKKIQIIMQDPFSSLSPRRKVSTLAMEALKLYEPHLSKAEIREKVLTYFLRCGLREEHLSSYPHELSGGQNQRVCIASILLLKPEIVICDEITSALDSLTQAKILNLMLDLREEFRLSYIFVSHNRELIDCFCDRQIVMR